MGRSKKDTDKQPSLTGERLKEFELFRHNLRILHAVTGLSAEKLGKDIGFAKHHRLFDLENGRATQPKCLNLK